MRALLKTEQLIERLNVTIDWWRHNGRRLMAQHGFPAPVAGIPHHWDPAAVDAWLDAQLQPEIRITVTTPVGELRHRRAVRRAAILQRVG